jgi:hypothetical protein
VEDLRELEDAINLPSCYSFYLGESEETCIEYHDGDFCVHRLAIDSGLRFPFPEFVVHLLNFYNLAPIQLVANSWLFISAFLILCGRLGIRSSVCLFRLCFEILPSPGAGTGFFHLKARKNRSFLVLPPKFSKREGWRHHFFWVGRSSGAPEWGFPTNPDLFVRIQSDHPPSLTPSLAKDLKSLTSLALDPDEVVTEEALRQYGLAPVEPRGEV